MPTTSEEVERVVRHLQHPDRRRTVELDVVGGAEARRRRRNEIGGAGQAAMAVRLDVQVPGQEARHPGRIAGDGVCGAGPRIVLRERLAAGRQGVLQPRLVHRDRSERGGRAFMRLRRA